MKLTHHDNGTWTLADMTDEQVHELAMGLGNLAAHQAGLSEGRGAWPGFDAKDADFFARQWRHTEHVRAWLDHASRWGTGLRRRASATYVPAPEAPAEHVPCTEPA